MNLETPATISLAQEGPAPSPGLAGLTAETPPLAPTEEVPEASTWILLLVAAALWLMRLRGRRIRPLAGR